MQCFTQTKYAETQDSYNRSLFYIFLISYANTTQVWFFLQNFGLYNNSSYSFSNLFKCSHNTYKIVWNVSHCVALPFKFKMYLKQKKNFGNSNISPCKNIILNKSFKRNQNPSRYYNSITKSPVSTQAKISPTCVRLELKHSNFSLSIGYL